MQRFKKSPLRLAPWQRKLAYLAAALGAVALLAVLLTLALPALVRHQGEKIASDMLGRHVTLGRVTFAPLSLQWDLEQLAVASADGQAVQFSMEHLHVDMALQSLWRLAPVLDALHIERPVLHLRRTSAGHYDVDDLLARWAQLQQAPNTTQGTAKDAEPAAFALYNITLNEGTIDFVDTPRTHSIRHIALSLPFISSLPAQRSIQVQPHLAWEINGSTFESFAQATPFMPHSASQVRWTLKGLDVLPYLTYLPTDLPVHLQSGVLDVDMALSFEQPPEPAPPKMQLQGTLLAHNVRLAEMRGSTATSAQPAQPLPLLELEQLKITVADLQPLTRQGHIATIEVTSPQFWAQRERDGRLRWEHWADTSSPSHRPHSSEQSTTTPWQWIVDRVTLRHAQIHWRDEVLGTEVALTLRGGFVNLNHLAWPLHHPLQFEGHAQLTQTQAQTDRTASFAFAGQTDAQRGHVALTVRDVPLTWAAPYLAQHLVPRVQGQLGADLGLAWNGTARIAQIAQMTLDDVTLTCPEQTTCAGMNTGRELAGVPLRGGPRSLVEMKVLRLENTRLDLSRQRVNVVRLALTQPRALIARDAQGRWMTSQWLRPAAVPATPVSAPSLPPLPSTSGAPSAPVHPTNPVPWSLQMEAIEIDDGTIALHDAQPAPAVALQLSQLRLRLNDFSPLPLVSKPSTLTLSARVGTGHAEPGRFEYSAALNLSPLSVRGQLHASALPLHALEPYVASDLNVRVLRADGSFHGAVAFTDLPAGPDLHLQGDAALDDVRIRSALLTTRRPTRTSTDTGTGTAKDSESTQDSQDSATNDDLLRWKSLGVRGLSVQLAPGQAPQIEVPETTLSDFFVRLIVQDNGHINLQDVLKRTTHTTESTQSTQSPRTALTTASAASTPAPAPAPLVRFGPISVVGGSVQFSDYFIQPNYSADLSGLTGKIGGFASASAGDTSDGPPAPELADLQLHGRAQGTASLEIAGKFNPLVQPLALDIVGKMHDLELPPLSPYTVKYTGHGIERGKLSMDVAYRITPDGQLTANNKLVLHQLVFGEPVEGAPTSLPVRLATALLADRNGVIDVDIPISGSLNDPQFRLGPVIFKLVGSLIMKAVTAPFSLLAHAFSGGNGADLEHVTFAPGSAQLDSAQQDKLQKIAQALQERPALRLTIVGQSLLEREREDWKNTQLQAQLLAQKRRMAPRDTVGDIVAITSEETPTLLKELYRRADIPKPRNVLGLLKDVPLSQMQTLLLAHMDVPTQAMHELAVARAAAVRDSLAQQHGIALERLFLGAVKTQASAENDNPDSAWQPQAQLSLSMP